MDLTYVLTKTKQPETPVEQSGGNKEHPKHIAQDATAPKKDLPVTRPVESGGQAGPEPTRYGDWEKKGRCTDF